MSYEPDGTEATREKVIRRALWEMQRGLARVTNEEAAAAYIEQCITTWEAMRADHVLVTLNGDVVERIPTADWNAGRRPNLTPHLIEPNTQYQFKFRYVREAP